MLSIRLFRLEKRYKIVLFIFLAFFIAALIIFFDFEKLIDLKNILELKDKLVLLHPFYSFAAVIGLYFIFSFLFLTIAPLSILSGIIFNTFFGAITSFIGSSINMTISFLLSRFFLNSLFVNLKNKNKTLQKTFDNLKNNGKNYILFARLFFITPYNALNIISGISDIAIKDYIIYSVLGCIPSTLFYAYSGSLLNNLKDYKFIKSNAIIISIVTAIFFLLIFFGKKILKNRLNKKLF